MHTHTTSVLSPEDARSITILERAGVLQAHDGSKLETGNGIILITCSDGDKILEFLEHIEELIREGGGKFRPHIFAGHGGAMLIAEDCPLYRRTHADEFLLEQIADAHEMKQINTVILMIHAPCGAAKKGNIDVVQELAYLVRAKKRVKEVMPQLNVSSFIDVHFADGKKKIMFVSSDAFDTWYQTQTKKAPVARIRGLEDLLIHPDLPGNIF